MTRGELVVTSGDLGRVAHRIAVARKANRMTQWQVAEAALISVSLLRKIEQGTRAATPTVLDSLARVLGVDASQLAGDLGPDFGRMRQAVLPLRYALDCHDLPGDGPAQPLSELRAAAERVTGQRLASQYAQLVDSLPRVLNQLHHAAHTYQGRDRERVFALLVMAYRAADAIADKYGFEDLSARAIELMRGAAARSGEPLLCGVAEYVRAELFFGRPHAAAGLRAVAGAADRVDPGASCEARAVYGSLHMRAAVLAANAGVAHQAGPHLDEAREAARRVPEPRGCTTALPSGHPASVFMRSRQQPSRATLWECLPALGAGNLHLPCLLSGDLTTSSNSHVRSYGQGTAARLWPRCMKLAGLRPSTRSAIRRFIGLFQPWYGCADALRINC
jgi:transcriptional regulator with XRE-family HTH domain